jgi:hypothetical protein
MPEVKDTEAAAATMKGAAVCFVKNARTRRIAPSTIRVVDRPGEQL